MTRLVFVVTSAVLLFGCAFADESSGGFFGGLKSKFSNWFSGGSKNRAVEESPSTYDDHIPAPIPPTQNWKEKVSSGAAGAWGAVKNVASGAMEKLKSKKEQQQETRSFDAPGSDQEQLSLIQRTKSGALPYLQRAKSGAMGFINRFKKSGPCGTGTIKYELLPDGSSMAVMCDGNNCIGYGEECRKTPGEADVCCIMPRQ